MTPVEGNALIYQATQGHPKATRILFETFEKNPSTCMDMIRTILRTKKYGVVWVREFERGTFGRSNIYT